MPNRVTIIVGGRKYTLVTEESEEYMKKVASYVDGQYEQQKQAFRVSEVDAAVMSALIAADAMFKAQAAADHSRGQIQDCLEDATRARAETAELKRELSRLKNSLK